MDKRMREDRSPITVRAVCGFRTAGYDRIASLVNPHDYVSRMRSDLDAALDEVEVHVFIMGPSPESDSDAGRLRRELAARCRPYGYSALMEHGEILEAVRAVAGRRTDLAYIEEIHGVRVDVMIFIPSSPGSFAEIGFFAGLARGKGRNGGRELIQKSVVLLDREKVAPRSPDGVFARGFVADGPVAFMEDLGAKVFYTTYSDVDGIWESLAPLLEAVRRFNSRG